MYLSIFLYIFVLSQLFCKAPLQIVVINSIGVFGLLKFPKPFDLHIPCNYKGLILLLFPCFCILCILLVISYII